MLNKYNKEKDLIDIVQKERINKGSPKAVNKDSKTKYEPEIVFNFK